MKLWDIPNIKIVAPFAKAIGCDWIETVPVLPDPSCDVDQCHANVEAYITSYGGTRTLGYYMLESAWGFQAILHSVWCSTEGKLIDITPFADNRSFNVFSKLTNGIQVIRNRNIYSQSLAKYNAQETENMYYVYALIDPRNELPFYIGKGKGRRAKTHLWLIPETRNEHKENKIAAIRAAGMEPRIEYLAEDIIDESMAYNMEEDLIVKYGRKGYESHGILTNICLSARPPNHKGMNYEQIYGAERAYTERKKRADLQKARGGYGPKKHSADTRSLLKIINGKDKNANNSGLSETDIIEHGQRFCNQFSFEISAKKWEWYCAEHDIPTLRKTYRFDGRDILEVFCEKFNAKKKHDSMLWFVNKTTGEQMRLFDWEVGIKAIPTGFVRGRGYIEKSKKPKV